MWDHSVCSLHVQNTSRGTLLVVSHSTLHGMEFCFIHSTHHWGAARGCVVPTEFKCQPLGQWNRQTDQHTCVGVIWARTFKGHAWLGLKVVNAVHTICILGYVSETCGSRVAHGPFIHLLWLSCPFLSKIWFWSKRFSCNMKIKHFMGHS